MALNFQEKRFYKCLRLASLPQDHDFGCIEDLIEVCIERGFTQNQVVGYLSDFSKKGIIQLHEPVKINGLGYYVQQYTYMR